MSVSAQWERRVVMHKAPHEKKRAGPSLRQLGHRDVA